MSDLQNATRVAIEAAVAAALQPESETFIKEMVTRALDKKESYGSETFLSKAIDSTIQQATNTAVQQVVNEKRDEIVALVKERLGDSFAEKLVAKVEDALLMDFNVSIKLGKEDRF